MPSLSRFFGPTLLGALITFFSVACGGDAATDTSSPQDARNPESAQAVDRPLQHLLDEYLAPYPDQLTAMSDPQKDTAVFVAMQAYNAGRYAEAVDLFPNSAKTIEQAGYIKLYQAVSILLAGRDQDALTDLGRITERLGKAYEISQWYLALNYVALNNVFAARRILEDIVANGAYPTERAKELLEDLPESSAE